MRPIIKAPTMISLLDHRFLLRFLDKTETRHPVDHRETAVVGHAVLKQYSPRETSAGIIAIPASITS